MAKTILVIDDDKFMRKSCTRILAKEGWTVLCAEDGEQGLQEVKNNPDGIDVVLVDQMMPVMSGMEAVEQIHALDPNLPVILMTGSATADTIQEAMEKGAWHCIPKPFTPNEIRDAIRSAPSKKTTPS
jgi:DNA-binding NtrC family response regulator